MDPKVCGKLLTHHRRGYGVDVEALRDRFPLRQIAGKGLDGISWVQQVAAVEKWFHGSPGYFRGIRVYIGERSRSVELRGAHEGGGAPTPWARPPTSWPPRCASDFHSKSPGLRLFQERSSRRFRSVWIPFDIPFLRNTELGKKQQFALGLRLIG